MAGLCLFFFPLNLAILFGVHTTILLLIWQSKLKEDVTGYSWIFLPISDVRNSGPLLLMLFPQIPVGFCLTLISCSSILIPFIRWIAFTLSIYIWSIYKYCKREEMFGRKNNLYLATGKRQERFWLQQLSLKAVMEEKRSLPSSSLGVDWKSESENTKTPRSGGWWEFAIVLIQWSVRLPACHSTLILRVLTKQLAPAGEAVRLKPEAVDWPQNGWWPMKLLLRWLSWPREGQGGRLCRTSTPEIWWMSLQRNRHT